MQPFARAQLQAAACATWSETFENPEWQPSATSGTDHCIKCQGCSTSYLKKCRSPEVSHASMRCHSRAPSTFGKGWEVLPVADHRNSLAVRPAPAAKAFQLMTIRANRSSWPSRVPVAASTPCMRRSRRRYAGSDFALVNPVASVSSHADSLSRDGLRDAMNATARSGVERTPRGKWKPATCLPTTSIPFHLSNASAISALETNSRTASGRPRRKSTSKRIAGATTPPLATPWIFKTSPPVRPEPVSVLVKRSTGYAESHIHVDHHVALNDGVKACADRR